MGVYIFACGPYIKVGKYSRSNPWSRVAHRLFRTCRCPRGLEISLDTLQLVAWFPDLRGYHEKRVHRLLKKNKKYHACGEWFHEGARESALRILHSMGRSERVLPQKKTAAMRTRRRL